MGLGLGSAGEGTEVARSGGRGRVRDGARTEEGGGG